MKRTALVNIGKLVTHTGSAPVRGKEMANVKVIPDAAMIWTGETIDVVGSRKDLAAELKDCDLVDAGWHLVTPGFIDCHTHLVFAGSRCHEFEMKCRGVSYEEIAALGGGILHCVECTRQASVEELVELARPRVQWLLSGGVTAFEVKSGYGLDLESELKMLRAIRQLGREYDVTIRATLLALHAIPPEYKGRREEYVDLVVETILPQALDQGLLDAADIFVEDGYFAAEDAWRLADQCKALRVPVRLHVDQFLDLDGAELAAQLGARSADHLEATSDKGIQALSQSDCIPVFLPMSVFALRRQQYPAARKMIDANLPVVLASDFNPGSAPSPSALLNMSLAALKMGMSAAECLTAYTLNAASVLGIESRKGTLEAGKDADFAIWDADNLEELIYWLGAPLFVESYERGCSLMRGDFRQMSRPITKSGVN